MKKSKGSPEGKSRIQALKKTYRLQLAVVDHSLTELKKTLDEIVKERAKREGVKPHQLGYTLRKLGLSSRQLGITPKQLGLQKPRKVKDTLFDGED